MKGIVLQAEQYTLWTMQIETDLKLNRIKDIQKGFDNLLSEKAYGGLDYAVFFDGAKINEDEKTEKVWQLVLKTVLHSGRLPKGELFPARAAKALNSLGGLQWLRDADRNEVNWQKKEFMQAYKNTPEPFDTDFRCLGLETPMYLENSDQKLLEH